MADDRSDAISNFMAFTGADETAALSMLSATGFDVEQAVNLYYAAGPAAGAGVEAPPVDLPPLEDDEAMARRLQQEGANPAAPAGSGGLGGAAYGGGEDEVRAPLEVYKNERLVGNDAPYRVPGFRRHAVPVPHNVVDAFRNFSRDPAGGAGGSGNSNSMSLAAMYEPPREMLFQGTFEDAKQEAQEKGRWLIVNLQSISQFGSHQLNRDTWRNSMVAELIGANFVLYQAYDSVEEGQKLQHFYKLFDIPAILIVDPVTGAPMRQWHGFIDAERLTEELLPFLEHDIHDPQASRLARRSHSRRDMGQEQQQQAQAQQGAASAAAEEDELQRALAMSVAGGGGNGGGSGSGDFRGFAPGAASSGFGTDIEAEEEEEEEEEETGRGHSPAGTPPFVPRPAAEVQADAAARLPQEPAEGSGCRIAVRLPDGSRPQRRFPAGATVASLYDFCLSQSAEASGGRKFSLSQGFPGAPALDDQQQMVEGAGLGGAMLVLKWLE